MSIKRRKKYIVLGAAMAMAIATCGASSSYNTIDKNEYNRSYESEGIVNEKVSETALAGDEVSNEENILSSLSDKISVEEKDAYKEETVYVFADNKGEVKDILVNEHLKNVNSEAVLTDKTDLTDIKNIKGYEEFTMDGDTISWKAEGNDIYYQGKTDKELPVKVSVKYFLDGKEMSPEEIAGKSGKVTIRYDYTNNATVTEEIGGKKEEVNVPFAAISGIVLGDNFKNIMVTNGKCIEEDGKTIVLGYALPGMAESLDIKPGVFNIPDYFEVTADVSDFSLEMGLTLIVNGSGFTVGGELDLSEIDALVKNVAGAGEQLEEGSSTLSDGAQTLYSKMGEFTTGLGNLKAAVNMLLSKVETLNEGVNKLDVGAKQVNAGVAGLDAALKAPMSDADKNAIAQTVAGKFAAGTDMYNQISAAAKQKFSATLTSDAIVNSIYNGLRYNADSTPSVLYLSLVNAGMDQGQTQEVAGASAEAVLRQYAAGIASSIANGAGDQIGASVAQSCQEVAVQAALAGADATKQKISAQIAPLVAGASSLADGVADLNSNMPALVDGVNKLLAGMNQLSTGANQLKDGADKLSSGAVTLKEGIMQFNSEAIDKIIDSYNGDVKGLSERVMAVFDAATQYDTFTMLDDGKQGTTKFIIKIDGISAE